MKLSIFADHVVHLLEQNRKRGADPEVVIPLKRPSVGYSFAVGVGCICNGIALDSGRIMLAPEKELDLIQYRPRDYAEIARTKLEQIKGEYNRTGFVYGCTRLGCYDWIDGFYEAMKMRFDKEEPND